ncbi:MAG: 2-polyprenylphenol 6-hydroxylase [Pseudomonadota bacterium]|nr:2-polyprenylphenol 6-hydroxylase [Pseudomonadota bacterium]
MFPRFGYLARLVGIARTLSRHDALFPLELLDAPPTALRVARLFAGRGRRIRERRPGQRLADALTDLGPSFIKLGQALSVRADLMGEDITGDLGRLRDRLPSFPFAEARATVERELGRPLEELFESFEPEPVAAASISQVHFATVRDGDTVRPVAVKILRPGIVERLDRDVGLFFWLADLVERAEPKMRRLRPRDVVRTMQEWIAIETDLRLEAAAADELREVFADDGDLAVPAIDWDRTAGGVMTMERVTGIPIGDNAALDAAGIDRARLAQQVIRVFLKQAMIQGFFHADMHQGNLFVEPDGTLVAVDFGIMGRLDRKTRLFMAGMLGAFIDGDYQRVAEVHFEAGYVPADKSVALFAQACRSIGAPIRGKPVSEISIGRLLAQLFRITETFDMQTRTELLLLQKTMVTVEGVARGLDPDINFWTAAEPVVEAWARDNMGPEARIADTVATGIEIALRVPRLLDRAEDAFDRLSALRDPPAPKSPNGPLHAAIALAALGGAALAAAAAVVLLG